MLDRIVDDIKRDRIDEDTVSEITDRTWRQLASGAGGEHRLQGCEAYQRLIPALVAGTMPEAKRMLVEDHTRECLVCRRILMEARGAEAEHPQGGAYRPSEKRVRPVFRQVAAAAVVLGLLAVGALLAGNLIADRRLSATVASVEGSMRLLTDQGVAELSAGDVVGSRRALRTGKQSGAVIRLEDGTELEVDERSEISLHGSLRGTTVQLTRGNIIVHAADQGRGRLYVSTQDCLLTVKGTVFAVDYGLKGSRVSVLEGEVEVRRPGVRRLLEPGDQYTTNERLRSVAIRDQIAWSRHSERHAALLKEINALQIEMAKVIEPDAVRTSTRLLDLAPADTRVFVAAPNLAEGLADARTVFAERLASSETLRSWWEENVVAKGYDVEINAMLDRIEPFAEAAGDEVVLAVPGGVLDGSGGPLVLFALDDPAAFESMVTEALAGEGVDPGSVLIDDPNELSEFHGDVVMWISGDLFAASNDLGVLQSLAARLDGAAVPGFPGTELHGRLSDSYTRGISWLLGADVGWFLDKAATEGSETDVQMLELLGVTDAGILIAERTREGDRATFKAELGFEGNRRGVAAWLAEPAPMGGLEFVSPDAGLAAAVVAKDPAEMFDEILRIVAATDPTAVTELAAAQQQAGIDIKADLVATLGGEAAFAFDGPVLPTPAWKLILEVYDPGTLQSTIERFIGDVNRKLESQGESPVELTTTTVDGITYHGLVHPKSTTPVYYAMTDGFMVVAPQQALVQRAIQLRASGATLGDSTAFQDLLPANGFTDCSALLYRNLEEIVAALPASSLGGVPPETLEQLGEPGVVCVYGLPDKIVVSGTGGDMFGFAPALGLSGLISQMVPEEEPPQEPVSSGP